MIKVEALTNFTKQAVLDGAKAIQALNEEQIQMRKAVIQNRMALDMLTAAQGGTCGIIKIEYCVYIPDLSGNVSKKKRLIRSHYPAPTFISLVHSTNVP